MSHLRFLWSLLRHKFFVLRAGLWTGVPLWRLIVHDSSKFTLAEWPAYVRRFGSGRAGVFEKEADPDDFHRAWTHHWHVNPHHWEHWLRLKGAELVPMLMPDTYVREMVADWLGAGRAYTGRWGLAEWYAANRERIILHDETRKVVDRYVERFS